MLKLICKIIWSLSEFTGIGMGRLAPYIVGGAIGAKPHKVEDKPKQGEVILAADVGNVPRKPGFGQVCVWPGFTIIDPEARELPPELHVDRFQNWMKSQFAVRVQFLEEVAIPHAEGEYPIIVFAVHNEDLPKFILPRLHFGIRWVEDATDPGNGPPLPTRFLGYRNDRQ